MARPILGKHTIPSASFASWGIFFIIKQLIKWNLESAYEPLECLD